MCLPPKNLNKNCGLFWRLVAQKLNVRSHSSSHAGRRVFTRREKNEHIFKKEEIKKRGSSNTQNLLPYTPHTNSFPFPLRGYIYKGRARRKVVFPYLCSETSFFTRRVLLKEKRALNCSFFPPFFCVLEKPQRGLNGERDVVDGFFFSHLLLGEGDFESRK